MTFTLLVSGKSIINMYNIISVHFMLRLCENDQNGIITPSDSWSDLWVVLSKGNIANRRHYSLNA